MLAHRTSVVGAYRKAFGLAARTAHIGVPVAVLYAVFAGLGGVGIMGLVELAAATEDATVRTWGQAVGALAAFLVLYTVIQFGKRARVSRASWFPSLFALPATLVASALMVASGAGGNQLLVPALLAIAWTLACSSVAGASTAIAWVRSGKVALDGASPDVGAITSEVRRRTLEVSAPHGARVHAVTIGIQVLLPGIFYALQYAFVDMVAVLDPEKPALRRSGMLTNGMRGRLFRVFLVWWTVATVVSTIVTFAGKGVLSDPSQWGGAFMEPMLDPMSVTPGVFVATELVWAIFTWVLTLALLVLYAEREDQVRARAIQKDRNAVRA